MATSDTTTAAAQPDPPGDPAAVVADLYGVLLQRNRRYPQPLPPELADWYMYLTDSGHSIAVIPATLWGSEDPAELLVPAPVKSVLRAGVEWNNGWPVVDLPYDRTLGLTVPQEDDEW